MTSLVQTLDGRIVGTVEEVSADRIRVVLDPEAPRATALNTGTPAGFPRVNGYVLIPNECGATVCVISSVQIERRRIPDRRRNRDAGLMDLPSLSRVMELTPLGTLRARAIAGTLAFKVQRGVDIFPSVGDTVHLPGRGQLRAIVQGEDERTAGRVLLGHCPTAGQAPVYVDPDKLFGRHLAVLGNTGAGKSCSVAGLIRWSLDAAGMARMQGEPAGPETRSGVPNARFIILDPNGEYARAFRDQGVRLFRVEPQRDGQGGKQLGVPAWLWNGAEWAAFTGASPGVQRPLLFDALRRLRSNLGPPDEFKTKVRGRLKRYGSRLSVAIQAKDHMTWGRREGVANVLLNLSKDFHDLAEDPSCTDANLRGILESVAREAARIEDAARSKARPDKPGSHYHDDFAESDLEEVIELLNEAGEAVSLEEGLGPLDEDTPRWFPLKELPDFVDALAADSSGRDIAQWVDTLTLRIRGLLAQGRLASVLQPTDSDTLPLEDWLADHVGADQAANGPIAVIDLSLVPSEVTHIVVSVLARMIFEAVQRYRRETGQELPTTLVLEEAHTFVHRDLSGESAHPAARECARVFERIAREGRKFGLGLVLASQRPSEVSPTVLSQCNTFLLHRLVNDRDQDLVRRLVPDGLRSLLRELPSLPTKRAMLLGWAAPAPTLVEVQEIPEAHRPHSPDPAFWGVWTGDKERRIDWAVVARRWQRTDTGDVVKPDDS
ncbi:MAG: DUF87 domain-containing protein [Gemmatimonadota bacterium]|nr:DUF87 domain-containing protein [Gemmatimonadota bacterium]MDE2983481.1 DUF87 domain-containing protein [Gemmatimonadota bacterium]